MISLIDLIVSDKKQIDFEFSALHPFVKVPETQSMPLLVKFRIYLIESGAIFF